MRRAREGIWRVANDVRSGDRLAWLCARCHHELRGRSNPRSGSIDWCGAEDRVHLPVIGCVAPEMMVLARFHVDAAAGRAFVHVAREPAELRVDVIVQHVAVAELEVDIVLCIASGHEPLLDAPRLHRLDVALRLFRQPNEERLVSDVWQHVPLVGDVISRVADDVSAFTGELTDANDPNERSGSRPILLLRRGPGGIVSGLGSTVTHVGTGGPLSMSPLGLCCRKKRLNGA